MTLRAVLCLEFIGENYWAYQQAVKRSERERREGRGEGQWFGIYNATMDRAYCKSGPIHRSKPWVARITGPDTQHGLARTFIDGQLDYSAANGTGSRGVYLYYALTPGIYEVYAHINWTKDRRYFIRVRDDATYTEIPDEEVLTCLRSGNWA